MSDYAEARTGLYLSTYGELKKFHEQIQTAQELRKKLPDNLDLLRMIFSDVPQIKPPAPDDLAALVDASKFIVDHADQVFSSKNKPANQTDDQWSQLKPQMIAYAQTQLDWVAEQQGQDAVVARLKEDPTRVALNVWLGKAIFEEAKKGHPEKQAGAIFHYARAAAYTGPGCLPDKDRAGMKGLSSIGPIRLIHGSAEGEDKLLAAAATQALPDGIVIESFVDVAREGATQRTRLACLAYLIALSRSRRRHLKAVLGRWMADRRNSMPISRTALCRNSPAKSFP